MATRGGLRRLATLYGMVEQMRSLELRVAAGAVDDVVCASAIEALVHRGQVDGGRAAMAAGDREEWSVAETTREVVEARIERLAKLRVVREVKLDEARDAHKTSRLKVEQMERVVERARAEAALVEDRKTQAVADDRFAARGAWTRAKALRET